MIYLGADHAGFKTKESIKQYFDKRNISYMDLGADILIKDDDYPEYAAAVGIRVARDKKSAKGILVCGTGNGMAIAANKISSIRAVVAWNSYTAKKSVEDDHANILSIPARVVDKTQAIKLVQAYLSAKPSTAKKHKRRVAKIKKLER